MPTDAYKNFAIATVATAPSPAASGTSLGVTAGQGARFPAVPFNATVWPATALPDPTTAEIVRVTARATDTLTITRAQEGSAARTIVAGDLIAATVTKKFFDDLTTGMGDVVGPASAPDRALALFSGTTGKALTAGANGTISGSLAIGSTPAQSGEVRVPNIGAIRARNYADNADQSLIASNGFDVLVGNFATTTYIDSIGDINLRGAVVKANGVVAITGFGTHEITASGTGIQTLRVRNTQAGASNEAMVCLGNDLSGSRLRLRMLSSTYTPATLALSDGAILAASGVGGLSIGVDDVSAAIRFYTSGPVLRWSLVPDGSLETGPVVVNTTFANLGSGRFNLGHAGSGSDVVLAFYNANGQVGTVVTSGSGTVYNTSSDQRLKRDLGPASDLSALRQVVIHDFEWLATDQPGRGVFAQEAHRVFPRAITVGGDDRSRPWMTDYSTLVPDLIVGWQQHDRQLATLLARLTHLEGRI